MIPTAGVRPSSPPLVKTKSSVRVRLPCWSTLETLSAIVLIPVFALLALASQGAVFAAALVYYVPVSGACEGVAH